MERKIHKIDAAEKVLGRLSTEISNLLRGKNKISYQPNIDGGDFVEVRNCQLIKLTGNKLSQKVYYHHSGYPGGLKTAKMKERLQNNPHFVLYNAVFHMIPANKLRSRIIKRLKFIE